MKDKLIKLDKIGSVLKNISLPNEVFVSPKILGKEGEVIVVEAIAEQKIYGNIELIDGRLSKIFAGDIIAGVLGQRKALEGIVGEIPKKIRPGDVLHMLNLGGVIGKAVSWNTDFIASPIPVKVIGVILHENKKVSINNFSKNEKIKLNKTSPIIAVIGTSMGTGKTTMATEIIHALTKKKYKVVAAKVTGVATQRDVLGMKDAGAKKILSFLDIGLASTINHKAQVVAGTKKIIHALTIENPDYIVIEFGDGIVGWYGVSNLLDESEISKNISFIVGCARDLTGAVGMQMVLKDKGLSIDFFSGPVANNSAGIDYIEEFLKIPTSDMRVDMHKFFYVLKKKGKLL